MSPENVALCQQAIEVANSGQKQAAYKQFCTIYNHGNTEDVTLLYWIAATTPKPVQAQITIDTIARLEPNHPKLPALRAYVDRELPLNDRMGPIVQCPYCHMIARTLIRRKISIGGWVLFAGLLTGLLVSFLVGSIIPVPIDEVANIGALLVLIVVVGVPLCFLALLIKEEYQVCASCGLKLG